MRAVASSAAAPEADAPLVSVVVPVYNGERWLPASLESLLAQTLKRFELILMDDASTDGTSEVVRAYDDPRIRYWRNTRNLGQFGNVNAGIGRARGEFVALLHADDVFEATLLEREVDYLVRNPAAAAVFCVDVFIDADGREFARLKLPPEFAGGRTLGYGEVLNGFLRYGNVFLRGQTSMIRRSVYRELGGFTEAYGLRGDLEMWLRIARRYPIGVLDEYLVRYRWGHENVSRGYERLRTTPELSFALLDDVLAGEDRVLAERSALRDYEAHRAEDLLRVAINQYVIGALTESRQTVAAASVWAIARSARVQRARLVVLWAGLHVLCRLPRLGLVAQVLYRRWGRGR